MAMLDCRAASWIALDILDRRARAFVTLPERAATAAARRLRHAVGGDTRIETSESGAAGLAGLLALISDPVARADLALDQTARVLLFNTEGGPPGRRQAP
jgi:diaminopropionate ammonia-lyase